MLKQNLVLENIAVGNIATVVGESPFRGIQGQVEVVLDEGGLEEEIILRVGPRDEFIISRCSKIKGGRIFVKRRNLRKDQDWNAWNRAMIFFEPASIKEIHFFTRPFIPENGYCMRENCFAPRQCRILVMNNAGRVVEYETCRECRDFWNGLSNVIFPVKKEHRLYLVRPTS